MVLMEAGTTNATFSNFMEYIILSHWPRVRIGHLPAGKDT